jgi:transposase
MSEFAAYLGIDWADQKHDVCLVDEASGRKEFTTLKHTPEALNQWALQLRARYGGQKVAVCLEQSRGPLIFALLKYDFLVLYPVCPKTLAKYREAFSPSRGKDDPTDAEYQVEILIKHRDRLKPWRPDDEATRTLQLLVEHRRRLINDRTRFSNRLTAFLKGYFPQLLDWFPDIRTELVCDFLLRWPTLESAQRARPATLEQFLRQHHSTRKEKNEQRLAAINQGVPLTTDRAVINSSVPMVQALAAQMKATITALKLIEAQLATLCQQHQDFHLFSALPGAGTVYAARLLAALGTDRGRYPAADNLACFAGVAPVLERSGQSCWIRWRYFCPKFLRQSFVEYAGESIVHCAWAKAYYRQQRAKGKTHQAAVRALAFKWIRIIWKCWQSRTPYDEAAYLGSLHKQGSPLWQQLNESQLAGASEVAVAARLPQPAALAAVSGITAEARPRSRASAKRESPQASHP